jgi:signal transduction histidine kinase
MKSHNLFYSFRARLLIVLAALLVATLGAQYYLNRRAERSNQKILEENARIIAEQERALADSIALAMKSIETGTYMLDLPSKKHFIFGEHVNQVKNVLLIDDNDWTVIDSLDERFVPRNNPDGSVQYVKLCDIQLAPLIDIGHSEYEETNLPCVSKSTNVQAGQERAFSIPVKTNKGPRHIIVELGSTSPSTAELSWLTSRPLMVTFSILFVATIATVLLVWPFTKPIRSLSEAARRVAAGDLSFRVSTTNRRDEMGTLIKLFNEMITRLNQTRELETRLNQAEKSAVIGRLASAIAHEIRNPLNYINLTLDHMRTTLAPEDEKKRELFERLTKQLKEEVARINRHISDFLKYSRPSKLEINPIDLRTTIEDALRLIEVQAKENHVETYVEQSEPIKEVSGDSESLRSVFTNLIINAMQAIDGKGGEIRVKLSNEEDNQIKVEITDTGPGIKADHLPQIFEPYFSTKETGTGLGLAIVKKAIDDHQGTIFVKSKEGEGTTFTILLPTIKKGINSEQTSNGSH